MASLQVIVHKEIETDTCCCVFDFFLFFALVLMDIHTHAYTKCSGGNKYRPRWTN